MRSRGMTEDLAVLRWRYLHRTPTLDAGHKLLETHAAAAVSLMRDFIRRTQRAMSARSAERGRVPLSE